MPKRESRVLESVRTYHGEEAAESLTNWLNFTEDADGRARIIEVVGTFMRRFSLGVTVPQGTFFERDGLLHANQTELIESRQELDHKLNALLSYYTVVPWISFPYHIGPDPVTMPYLIAWRAAPGSLLKTQQLTFDEKQTWRDEFELPGVQMAESGAIRVVLDLLQTGLIFKVRRCRCEIYFFQRFSHQRFCSGKCRLAASRDSDDSRKKRNEYARNLYQLKKAGKVK